MAGRVAGIDEVETEGVYATIKIVPDGKAHSVNVRGDEVHAGCREVGPQRLAVKLPQRVHIRIVVKGVGKVRNYDVLRAELMQFTNFVHQGVYGVIDQIGYLIRCSQSQGMGNVVSARADQIKSVGICPPAICGKVGLDLRCRRNRLLEIIPRRREVQSILGTAGGVIGAASGRVGRKGLKAKERGERLRIHAARARSRLAGAMRDAGRPIVVVIRAPAGNEAGL